MKQLAAVVNNSPVAADRALLATGSEGIKRPIGPIAGGSQTDGCPSCCHRPLGVAGSSWQADLEGG